MGGDFFLSEGKSEDVSYSESEPIQSRYTTF
jgi:hypothetical protein